eukprot:6175091-Pleurochrysis_carterae.AAC.2
MRRFAVCRGRDDAIVIAASARTPLLSPASAITQRPSLCLRMPLIPTLHLALLRLLSAKQHFGDAEPRQVDLRLDRRQLEVVLSLDGRGL